MKIALAYIVIICLFVATACQKGIHWEIDSEGELVKDSAGNCLPITIAGTFAINKPTGDTNFLTVSVNITAAGNYSITSDSINGYIFKSSGHFSNTGVTSVKLTSSGTPLSSGTDHFSIHYNNSVCEAFVTVLSDTIPPAAYTLQGSPNSCMNDTVKGSYLQSVSLDTSNKVVVSVNVITPGKYSISTNTVNGYSFTGEGVFKTTGEQPVIIKGSGTPLNAGGDNFILNADNAICSFSVAVSLIVQVTDSSHFPLTQGSYWAYVDPAFNDTVKRYINGDSLINDTGFIRLSESGKYSSQNYFYNFDGLNYSEFGKVDNYTSSFQYSPLVYGLLPVLKEHLVTGASWQSPEFKGTASYGQVLYIKYNYYCLNNNLSIVVNGFGFKDVYLVAVYPYLKSEGNPYGSTGEIYYYYFAKGVGLILLEESINGYPFKPALQITDWKVN